MIPGGGNGNPLQHSCLEIPWKEEPVRLPSQDRQEFDVTEQLNMHAQCMIT